MVKLSDITAPAVAGVVREATIRAAIAEIKNCMYDGADMIGNQWKNESVIDFDNPISKGEDVSQSMYFALLIGWEKAT